MKKLLVVFAASVMVFGLSMVVATPTQAHTGKFPHANAVWGNPDCILYVRVGGSFSTKWKFNPVVREYRNKVPPLPAMRGLGGACPKADKRITIEVDQVRNKSFCWNFDPTWAGTDRNRIRLNFGPRCDNHRREWSCAAVGHTVGMHSYNRTGRNVRKGCKWTGIGPNHVAPVEDRKLTNAWN